jgi:hypothetical protein
VSYQRRTDDDRVAELNAKIEGIRARAARKAARANPAVRQATIALKAIERAIESQPNELLRPALEQALALIRPAITGSAAIAEPTQMLTASKRRPRTKAAAP